MGTRIFGIVSATPSFSFLYFATSRTFRALSLIEKDVSTHVLFQKLTDLSTLLIYIKGDFLPYSSNDHQWSMFSQPEVCKRISCEVDHNLAGSCHC